MVCDTLATTTAGLVCRSRLIAKSSRYGVSSRRTTAADTHATCSARVRRPATISRPVRARIAGAAKKIADEWDCTARIAAAVAAATHHNDLTSSANRTHAMDILTKATASGGFQMDALSDMSSGAVAINSVTASASARDPKRFQIATTSMASAAD